MARLAYWAGHARVCHERRRTHARVRRRGCRGVRPPLRPAQGRRVPVSPPPLPAERDRRRALPGCVVEPDPRPRELCTDGEVHDLAVSPRAQPLDRSPSRRGSSHAVSADDEAHEDLIAAIPAARADEPLARAEARELGERLRAAVAALPPAQRDAFLLQQEGGLSLAEIAALTGVG